MSALLTRRRTLIAGAAALAAPAARARAAAGAAWVAVTTDKGVILLALASEKAPVTTANFLRYVDARRFDGASFYRAVRSHGDPTSGLIEGGLQNDPGKLFAPIAHESTTMTGLSHQDGTISMARYAPGTATADFFICAGPAPYLDAHPDAPGDNAGYAAFGQVIRGMDVVRAILALPTNGVARNPVMQGQILSPPVAIVTVRRAEGAR
ncbi:MAG TPA: peptidylprolyl isomerase [Caulobacteraceae bacterium]|nr:peptidylprolyl isomerase [Caulobacteraceae bacterium]